MFGDRPMEFEALKHRDLIRVWIKNGKKGFFKVTWDDNVNPPFGPYFIDKDAVTANAADIRTKLEALVDEAINDPEAILGPLLKDLAKAGRELYDTLFGKDPDHPGRALMIKRWLEGKPQPLRLNFIVDGYVHIPWSLIFGGDHDRIPNDSVDIAHFSDFWCLKYLLTCTYKGLDPITAENGQNANAFRLLPILHQSEIELSQKSVPPSETEDFNGIIKRFGFGKEKISSLEALSKAWTKSLGLNKILFFYCHAHGTRLEISESESIEPYQFKSKLQFPDDHRVNCAALTFLNGCSTAVGDDAKGFIEATTREGFCGFIGTETDIPNVYALRFGAAFIKCMLETGWSVLDVVDAMRRAHWPLSLLYQIYGSPTFRVAREPATRWSAPLVNFSRGPIGEKQI
jgi:hypothetical protein